MCLRNSACDVLIDIHELAAQCDTETAAALRHAALDVLSGVSGAGRPLEEIVHRLVEEGLLSPAAATLLLSSVRALEQNAF
ncbi:hypothetical protein D6789_02235 [Candidatus Woesearchaeota archaeon]|nr:MAG: hypothetical protein D6789_02235 [Candidatus Woesearchaeota archaeon]